MQRDKCFRFEAMLECAKNFSEMSQYEILKKFFRHFFVIVPAETDRMAGNLMSSIGAILKLFCENSYQKTKETDRNSKCSCLPIFAISPTFVPYSGHSMKITYSCSHFFLLLQICHEQGLNALYKVFLRINIKYRLRINGILLDVTFNIALLYLIPPSRSYPYHDEKRIFYKMPCRDIHRSCRKNSHLQF
jgi:hypothetical protein